MSHTYSEPELHAQYVIDEHLRAAFEAARREEAQAERRVALAGLRLTVGTLLIGLGQRIRPAAPSSPRVIVPRATHPTGRA